MSERPAPEAGPWAVIARLGRTHGLAGAIYADAWHGAGRFAGLEAVWVRRPDGSLANEGRPYKVRSAREVQGRLLIELEGIGAVEAAHELTGCEMVVPEQDRAPLAEGEFYLSDLVGCEVWRKGESRPLGVVRSWQEFGGPPTLEVDCDGEMVWIPCVRAVCVAIEPERRRIEIDPPEGLLELNAGEGRP